MPDGPPYRPPCGGWDANNLPSLGDCSGCEPTGWKAVQAQKNWHGAYAFDHCEATACTLPETKYRTWSLTGTYNTGYTTIDGGGICTVVENDPVNFSVDMTVDRNSGIISVSNCTLDEFSAPVALYHYTAGCIGSYTELWNYYTPPDANGCGEVEETLTTSATQYTHTVYDPNVGTPESVAVIRYTVTVDLEDAYSLQQCYDDAVGLLSVWDLTDDDQYPWEPGAFGTVHYIHYDESGSNSPLNGAGPDLCDYVDSSGYTGAIVGAPGDEQYLAAQPEGAFILATVATVYAQKWCAVQPVTPSFNHFRPCGDDRNDARFTSIAWPICGRCAVESATQNGGNVELVLADATPYLQTGDYIDTDGLPGIGDNLLTTVTDSTHIYFGGTLSSPYTDGGYIWSHGAPSYWWDDVQSKGDYAYVQWWWDPCADGGAGTFECSDECLSFPPCLPVAIITPNGESNGSWNLHTFPTAISREYCWQALARFTIDDYLWDQALGAGPQVEARCTLPVWNGETAPDVPAGFVYGCVEANTLCDPPSGGCAAANWPWV